MTQGLPGRNTGNAQVFMTEDMARRYRYRPPHPAAVGDVLLSLLGGADGPVLDVGCGIGDLARRLAPEVTRVDAVDVSAAMIAEGRRQEHGDHPNLRWINARIEEAELDGPYALAAAGDSLDWTDLPVALPRLHDALTPDGVLAIVQRTWGTGTEEERDIFRRYSTIRDYQPYDLVPELVSRNLFKPQNHLWMTATWRPTIEEYVESRHAQAGFSREAMPAADEEGFDRDLTALLTRLLTEGRVPPATGGRLRLEVTAVVAWGRPLPAAS